MADHLEGSRGLNDNNGGGGSRMSPQSGIRRQFLLKSKQFAERRVIKGYREYLVQKPIGHALLSYLVVPLLPPSFLRNRTMFSNRGIAQEIPRILNEMGFIVDIVNFTNRSWLPKNQYDIFIGHGGHNFENLSKNLPQSTCRIYFSTGIYWKEHNRRLAQRASDLSMRRGVSLPPVRAIVDSEEYANQNADGIVCLGNSRATQTFSKFQNVAGINNGIYPLSWVGWLNKDYSAGGRRFLFFAGHGHLLKGLDLVIEAFAGTDLELHICQQVEPDFMALYKDVMNNAPNIHLHGFVKMRSAKFMSLAAKCNWVLTATCTEGQPGAILECMAHGLVPLLPETANIDIDSRIGIQLPECSVEAIRATAIGASNRRPEEIRELTKAVAYMTREQYSLVRFRDNLKLALSDIVKAKKMRLDRTSR